MLDSWSVILSYTQQTPPETSGSFRIMCESSGFFSDRKKKKTSFRCLHGELSSPLRNFASRRKGFFLCLDATIRGLRNVENQHIRNPGVKKKGDSPGSSTNHNKPIESKQKMECLWNIRIDVGEQKQLKSRYSDRSGPCPFFGRFDIRLECKKTSYMKPSKKVFQQPFPK